MSISALALSLAASFVLSASAYGQNTRVKDGHPAASSPQSSPASVKSDGTIATAPLANGGRQPAKPAGSSVPIIMFTQWTALYWQHENAFASHK